MNRKAKLGIIAVLIIAIFGFGIGLSASIRWKGTGNVFNINKNLDKLELKIVEQKEKIDELESKLDNTVSKADHDAIVKQMQDRYENDIAAKDKIIQDYMVQVQNLKNELAALKTLQEEYDQAYKDVLNIDQRVEDILQKAE